jgi:hypothetical protein
MAKHEKARPVTGQGRQAAVPPALTAATSLRALQLKPQRPSRALLRFFDAYLHFFMRRHFHALRLGGAQHWPGSMQQADGEPLLICLNHPSWWDPLTAILLSRWLEAAADHYAPMDAVAFSRYGILRRLGLFPVEQGTRLGAMQFLRGGAAVLHTVNSVLWVTPQGEFTDARTRPVVLRGGLDALLQRVPRVTVVPLALEYTFWDERLPEALALLGEPLHFTAACAAADANVGGPGEKVAAALALTQDALARLAARRDPDLFISVLTGGAGTSGIYGVWQRLNARLRGKRFNAEHASLQGKSNSHEA